MDFFGNQDGPGGLFAHLTQGLRGGFPHAARNPPRAFDEYLKAYSVAMLPGKQRDNLSYGGKIIMPPSALAHLSNLEIEGPWMFELRNPANSAASTHAGVLEFIAEEGVVHLPYWMMKTLRLNEGDPIRITGTELPKGKLVKLQAQSVHFLEISDHRAVLEQALRNFTALTQGDIIEICYNSIVFGLLVMETTPGGGGISVLDTDLEVDFAAPVGYVEPERPKTPPPATMASKLKIDLNSSSPGSSRPGSSLSGGFTGAHTGAPTLSKGGDQWESFKGRGETLGGRKTKGRGVSHRQIEQVAEGSKIIRTDQHRIVSNGTFEGEVKVPAALNLPFGQLFFGFNVPQSAPPPPPEQSNSSEPSSQPASFQGPGNTLTGRGPSAASTSQGKGKEKAVDSTSHSWGSSGQSLGARTLQSNNSSRVNNAPPSKKAKAKQRSPSPEHDWGVDDDDVIMIDSD
ncbi:ubiquitin fusion degradation protein [Pleurotus ostreatus]|uniref:Ubiquitin fusion degradation protein n=1 Tax=Pleurotus ostreatus TaxID=5322 RepID=A0A8H7A4W4_PLEOS|nr:ubiquitin fusion degradation protein [Pleurotus ostreatus]KAF7440682.1 ubiquitin fusion degradation protein [Pleurotus ostreatus]KAJ8699928.1 ubiquitin fusion degradation protein [Pleurotus ostreatus]